MWFSYRSAGRKLSSEKCLRGGFDGGGGFEGFGVDFCRELSVISCQCGRNGDRCNEEGKCNRGGVLAFGWISQDLKEFDLGCAGRSAAFSQDRRWDPSPYW